MKHPLVWTEIDLKALGHNVNQLNQIKNPNAQLMAVVKANAYGHGAVKVSKKAIENGASYLGVARINEAMILRKAGIDVPILIFGYTPSEYFKQLIEFDLDATVNSFEVAQQISNASCKMGKKIKVHLKVDSGMGRLGVLLSCCLPHKIKKEHIDYALKETENIAKLPAIDLIGIYTHFATAEDFDFNAQDNIKNSYSKKQFEIFIDLLDNIKKRQIDIKLCHAANSAATINMPETHLDMIRPGISIYGLHSEKSMEKRINLKPVMSLKTKIINLKKVPKNFYVSYGITYKTQKATTIATVPIGYADGYNRLFSSSGHMLVNGQRAPVIGRVCMDFTMLDVGHIEVSLGDEVVVFGKQGDLEVTVDELANKLNTINYEIVSTISERVQRIYID